VTTATYYIGKRGWIDAVVAQFYQHKLPIGEELPAYSDDVVDAFARISRRCDISDDLRQFLSMTVAEVSTLRMQGKFLPALRAVSVLDAAVDRYRAELNARGAA